MDFKYIDALESGVVLYLGIDSPRSPTHSKSRSRQKVESNQLIYEKCVVKEVFFQHLDDLKALSRAVRSLQTS